LWRYSNVKNKFILNTLETLTMKKWILTHMLLSKLFRKWTG
jgi:hypothetical protein